MAAPAVGVDPDAQAFFDRVTAAGGTLTSTEEDAVNTLVLDLKSYSIWADIKAAYPMVGSSAAACAQNLKSSSFTGTFYGGITYVSTGVAGDGISGYMDTFLVPNTDLSYNDQSYICYIRNAPQDAKILLGAVDSSFNGINFFPYYSTSGYCTINEFVVANPFTAISLAGCFILSRKNSNDKKLFYNGGSPETITSTATNYTVPSIYLMSRNGGTPLQFATTVEFAFASIGNGLSDAQAGNYYTAIQAFQTTLSRQV